MYIAILTTKFRLHGCHSLKDKRSRLKGLRDKFGSIKHIAVCESDDHDDWQFGEMSFLCIANDKNYIESSLSKIVNYCRSNVDAELVDDEIAWI